MAHYQLRKEQFLKTDIDTIWDFASSPANLKEITPDYMLFDITSKGLPEKMYPGMIITYNMQISVLSSEISKAFLTKSSSR